MDPDDGTTIWVEPPEPGKRGALVIDRAGMEGDGPFSGFSRCKEALDATLAENGQTLASWVLHDLRRTAATGMAEIGIQPHVIEAVLNHVSGHKGGIAGIYNRAQYGPEKAQALARWDVHVQSIVDKRDGKVVGMRGRR
jgi:hypothetical protein